MGDKTEISWSEATWNPSIGCTKVSAGCDNCYAESVVNRWQRDGSEAWPARFDTISLRPERFLTIPIGKAKPTKFFVNSLSDVFHKDVPDTFIAELFGVMAITQQHTYQMLTKRHGRMCSLLNDPAFEALVRDAAQRRYSAAIVPWPLPNLHLGVSVENQQWADARIPALLDTPAAVRWISAEPLLGPLDLTAYLEPLWDDTACGDPEHCSPLIREDHLDWVVVGGESGPGARPMHPDWARALRDQCASADVPFFFKQAGEVLAREWGCKDKKGSKPAEWPEPHPQEYPR